MASEHMKTVIDFCLEHAADAPVKRRVKLYRGLAEFCGDTQQAAHFNAAARDLESVDARILELGLPFRQMQPASDFCQRADVASHDPAAGIPEAHLKLAREIIRLTRGEEWTRVEQFVFEVAVLIGRNLQP